MWKPVGNNQKAVTESMRLSKPHLQTEASTQRAPSTRQPVFSQWTQGERVALLADLFAWENGISLCEYKRVFSS